jgi:hypothetical protein
MALRTLLLQGGRRPPRAAPGRAVVGQRGPGTVAPRVTPTPRHSRR